MECSRPLVKEMEKVSGHGARPRPTSLFHSYQGWPRTGVQRGYLLAATLCNVSRGAEVELKGGPHTTPDRKRASEAAL